MSLSQDRLGKVTGKVKTTTQLQNRGECRPEYPQLFTWGKEWSNASTCPLNVCCSKFGLCGTTSDFCGNKVVISPQFGYYEGWNLDQRLCDKMAPVDIPLGIYTLINFAFALIDPTTFRIAPMDLKTGLRYHAVTTLKERQPSLSVSFIENNGFDGVDLDWEYPVADDRGEKPEDYKNFVNLIMRLRKRPASYWYLREFDIVHLEPHVDFLNIMTYDIHGVWDGPIESLGQYAFAHTNLTGINLAPELLWRNNINPARINLGLGFYGRSFNGGRPGPCTNTTGVLSATEVSRILREGKGQKFLDEQAAVQVVVFDKDQWVAFDDTAALKSKLDFANRRCLGGTMVWAVDLDDGALIASLGEAMGRKQEFVSDGFPGFIVDLGTSINETAFP
ncbi:glycoside hydrolase superfamily [Aspergillus stella-maris]|uniref:glycoside hydrolase superfamily n=1 Tax=Aspergillus stella-maris TaxID=1810926 RepID=UPI003CCDC01C